MAFMVKIKGVEEIKKAMRKAEFKLGWSARKGLMKGGLFLQRESQKIVPVDKNNLKPSAGTKAIGQGWYTDVIVYYTAAYATYVHEITTNKHKKGKSAKYLEKPAREKRLEILAIIAGEMENI